MLLREDVAWAAGLFEGEGCFSSDKNNFRSAAALGMRDEDVVRRFQRVVGIGVVNRVVKPTCVMWYWRISGFENVQAVYALFWPWLGDRRRIRGQEALAIEKQNTRSPYHRYHYCRRGHRFTEYRNSNGKRQCLPCTKERLRKRYSKVDNIKRKVA